MKLRKEDKVIMLSGRDKGKTGTITRIMPKTSQVIADGLNVVKRHTKPSSKVPRGGILEKLAPIHSGKVALVCPACKKPTRIGIIVKGKVKERVCRKCQAVIK